MGIWLVYLDAIHEDVALSSVFSAKDALQHGGLARAVAAQQAGNTALSGRDGGPGNNLPPVCLKNNILGSELIGIYCIRWVSHNIRENMPRSATSQAVSNNLLET